MSFEAASTAAGGPPSNSPAPAPFAEKDADLILRSSENMDFRVYRGVIYAASPVLKDQIMQVLGAKPAENQTIPILSLPHSNSDLYMLLSFLYPMADRWPSTITRMCSLLQALRKYKMDHAVTIVRSKLISDWLARAPAWVYVIACSCQLEDEAKVAAARLREATNAEALLEAANWGQVPPRSYLRLLQYLRADIAPQSFTSEKASGGSSAGLQEGLAVAQGFTAGSPFDGETPWDAILLSSDKIKFHVSKVVLSIASPFFQDMFGLPQAPDSDPEGSVIPVTENSSILNALLRICYPIPDPTVSQPMDLYQLVITADKYHLPAVTNWARERLLAVARDQPLAAYAAACCLGWNPEAKLSAKEALKFTVAELEAFSEGSGLELVSCECIRRLLAYHRACREHAAWGTLSKLAWFEKYSARNTWCICVGTFASKTDSPPRPERHWDSTYVDRASNGRYWDVYFDRAAKELKERPGNAEAAAMSDLGAVRCMSPPASHRRCIATLTRSLAREICKCVSEVKIDIAP